MRRWVSVAVFVAVAALVVAAGAVAKGPQKGPKEHELVEWTIPAGQCSYLPADLVLTGVGTSKTMDKVKTKSHGVMTENFRETVRGTATDNMGGHYTFHYVQTFKGSSPGTGIVNDHFDLSGDGVANLLSEFVINFEFGPDFIPTSEPEFIVTAGDPENCDPI